MGAHPVAVAPDVDDVAVVQQAVDQRGRYHLVAEHPAPVLEALVGRQHRRSPFVTRVDQLKEENGAVLAHRLVADLVHHQQCRMRQHIQSPCQIASLLGFHERLDQAREGAVSPSLTFTQAMPANFG